MAARFGVWRFPSALGTSPARLVTTFESAARFSMRAEVRPWSQSPPDLRQVQAWVSQPVAAEGSARRQTTLDAITSASNLEQRRSRCTPSGRAASLTSAPLHSHMNGNWFDERAQEQRRFWRTAEHGCEGQASLAGEVSGAAEINDCAWTDAIGARPVETCTRRDAPQRRSSVATRYAVTVPTSAPSAPARAGQDRAIGRLLVVSQATRRQSKA
jgi:hypothetical protein